MLLKSGLIREVASIEGPILVVFYYISASEIWPYKRSGLVVFYYISVSEICSEECLMAGVVL